MKTTISVIKADIGSIGGHVRPSNQLLETVREFIIEKGAGLLHDFYMGFTGDDICLIFSHSHGKASPKIHKLAWDAFKAGTEVAKEQGLYGAGQDLLVDAFSGNVKGLGPAVAEMEFEERPNEPFVVFAADKTDPGAYNLPLYLSFSDPMHCSGLILSPKMSQGFCFVIMDVNHIDGDRVITLNTPEEAYDLATLLRDNQRFVIESIHSRANNEQAVAVSTTRLHNIAGTYTGKDDPVAVVRVQQAFPATGEIISPYAIGHLVAGFMRGSHTGPLMPVKKNTCVSYFDGPPVVSALAFSIRNGRLTEPADLFDQPFWDRVRERISDKAIEIRLQGFSGAAMLPMGELEYTGIMETLNKLEARFELRMEKKLHKKEKEIVEIEEQK